MKDPIQYLGIEDQERPLRLLAASAEQTLALSAKDLSKRNAFASTTRMERTGLSSMMHSSHAPLCGVEFSFSKGAPGAGIWLMQASDLWHLGELLTGVESQLGNPIATQAEEACLRFFACTIHGALEKMHDEHGFECDALPPRFVNSDGKPARLSARQAEYESCVCITFQLLIEDELDSRVRLLLKNESAAALAGLLVSRQQSREAAGADQLQRSAAGRSQPSHDENPPCTGASRQGGKGGAWNIDLLLDVELPVAISFGETSMQLKDVLKLGIGSVVELDKSVNDPVTVIVNQKPIATGEVVMVEGNYGVRILEVESAADRIRSLGQ